MAYGTVSRGYKSAQMANVSFTDPTSPPKVVLPEKPLDFQLGLKSSFLNNRLAANINLFRTNVKNYQTNRCVTPSPSNPATLICIPTNVSKVITKGVEGDLFGRIGRNLTINANFLYNIAKYPADFRDNAGRSLGGQQLAFAPRWKTTLAAEYAASLGGNLEGFLSADATYKGETRLGIDRATADFIYPSRFILGGRLGARVNDRWNVALFVRNLTSKSQPITLGNSPPPLGDPAEAGIWQWQNQQSRRLVGVQADLSF
jgi:iron complex outermembrane receptor protein